MPASLPTSPRRCLHALTVPLILLFTLLISCSGSGKPHASAATASSAGEQTTVTWSFWGDPWEDTVSRRIARTFEREHPEIHVQIEHHPWGEYFSWLKGEWGNGRSPDVMFLNYIPAYAATGELEPIDRFVARDSLALSDFYPALLDSFRYNGGLYGLPRDNDTKVIYYNRALLDQAGIPYPTAGWTWDDLRAIAQKLTVRDGGLTRYGFGFEPDYWWLPWLWQRGGDVVDDPFKPATTRIDAPESIAALQFLGDLVNVDRVTPPVDMLDTDDMSKLFRDGLLAMLFGNHALVPWFTETQGLSWDVAPLPRDAQRANIAGGAGYVMSRRAQNKDAAWQLIKFLTGPKAQAILTESGVITPARRSVREDNIFMRQQPYNAQIFVAETEQGRAVPNFPNVTELYRVVNEGLTPVWRGQRSAADVAHDLAPRVQAALAPATTPR